MSSIEKSMFVVKYSRNGDDRFWQLDKKVGGWLRTKDVPEERWTYSDGASDCFEGIVRLLANIAWEKLLSRWNLQERTVKRLRMRVPKCLRRSGDCRSAKAVRPVSQSYQISDAVSRRPNFGTCQKLRHHCVGPETSRTIGSRQVTI